MTAKTQRDPKLVRMDFNGRVRLLHDLHKGEWYYVRHDHGGVVSLVPTGVAATAQTRRIKKEKAQAAS